MTVPATIGGPIIIILADGIMLAGRRKRGRIWGRPHPVIPSVPADPEQQQQLVLEPIGSWLGGVSIANMELLSVSLQPREKLFSINSFETFTGGEDERISLFSPDGMALFTATDIAVPPTIWRGDDAFAPLPLLDIQTSVDQDWQAELVNDPTIPRWIVEGQFIGNRPGDSIRMVGWDKNGHAIVQGRANLELRCPEAFGPTPLEIGPHDWWGRIAPNSQGQWNWTERGFGLSPITPFAKPPFAVDVKLSKGQLYILGVAQTNPELAAGILAFDGPFT